MSTTTTVPASPASAPSAPVVIPATTKITHTYPVLDDPIAVRLLRTLGAWSKPDPASIGDLALAVGASREMTRRHLATLRMTVPERLVELVREPPPVPLHPLRYRITPAGREALEALGALEAAGG